MSFTAFFVRVPTAEGVVAELRSRYDTTVQLGVHAHVSILFPFMAPTQVTPAVLAAAHEALKDITSFDFTLRQVGRFPTTAYLALEPPDPFIAMTASLVRTFPEFLPYGGEHTDVIPRLTVAHGDTESASVAARRARTEVAIAGPIEARCTSVVLLENSTGQWRELYVFELPASANSPA